MPRRRNDSQHIEDNEQWILEFQLHLAECGCRIAKNVLSSKAQMPHVVGHVKEGDRPRPTLRRVEPVAGPGIVPHVRLTAPPYVEPVKSVIPDRNPNPKQFQKEYKWEAGEKCHLLGIGGGTFDRNEVR